MRQEIETIIQTEDGVRVSVSEWDDGGAYLHLILRHGTAHVILTRNDAEKLMAGLGAILANGVAA